MPPFRCASRSISQSLAALPASRQRPYQSVVFGRKSIVSLEPGSPRVVLSAARSGGRFFQERLTNIVWVSSIGTQARLLTRSNAPCGVCVQNGKRKLAKRQYVWFVSAGR